jgi:hypothetical protein
MAAKGEPGPATTRRPGAPPDGDRETYINGTAKPGWVIETEVSPFHCLYQDALHFHSQSRLTLMRS